MVAHEGNTQRNAARPSSASLSTRVSHPQAAVTTRRWNTRCAAARAPARLDGGYALAAVGTR
jgi:hypothetical protein